MFFAWSKVIKLTEANMLTIYFTLKPSWLICCINQKCNRKKNPLHLILIILKCFSNTQPGLNIVNLSKAELFFSLLFKTESFWYSTTNNVLNVMKIQHKQFQNLLKNKRQNDIVFFTLSFERLKLYWYRTACIVLTLRKEIIQNREKNDSKGGKPLWF